MFNQNVVSYVPARNRFGKFKSIRIKKFALKLIKLELIAISLLTNIWFAHHFYVVRCSAGGMFMTQEKCGEIAQNKFDSQELARVQFLQANNQTNDQNTSLP